MKFIQHASSSKGNLYEIVTSKGRIIIDPGIRKKPLQKALDFKLDDIICCLQSHSHLDHSKSMRYIMDNAIDVYGSKGTFGALDIYYHYRAKVVADKTLIRLGDKLGIFCFNTVHDAVEPLGFVIRDGDEYLLFATDTKVIKQKFEVKFSIVAIECSYDREILLDRVENKTINEVLAKRLLSSHMEAGMTKRYLRECCDLSKCHSIHLLHLSPENIDAEKARKEIEDEFFIKTTICS